MTEDQTVWIKKRGARGTGTSVHVHTDPDCIKLQQAAAIKETRRVHLPDDWPECSVCNGTAATGGVPQGKNTQARRELLQQTDPDEV